VEKFNYHQEVIVKTFDSDSAKDLVILFEKIINDNPEISLANIEISAIIEEGYYGESYPRLEVRYKRKPISQEIEERKLTEDQKILDEERKLKESQRSINKRKRLLRMTKKFLKESK
jgi:RNA binding exosome subunit